MENADDPNNEFGEDHQLELMIFKILFPDNNICFLCLAENHQNNPVVLVEDEKSIKLASLACRQELDESVPLCTRCQQKLNMEHGSIDDEDVQDFDMEESFKNLNIQINEDNAAEVKMEDEKSAM